jgi:AcrR family transcriptional regulator
VYVTPDTRETISAVALELFLQQGYEHTSMREIADRVGITKASLYYHHRSKQELLLAIVEPLVAEWRAIVAEAETLDHTPEHIRHVLGRSLDAMLGHRAAAGIFLRDAVAVLAALVPLWPELLDIGTRLHTWLAGPSPAPADLVRGMAATEVLGTALRAAAVLPELDETELRGTLLSCATAVLGL